MNPDFLIWTIFIVLQATLSLAFLLYVLLTKHKTYFKTLDYVVLMFIPILGILHTAFVLYEDKDSYSQKVEIE